MRRAQQKREGAASKSLSKLTEKQKAKRLKEVRKRAFALCEQAFLRDGCIVEL